MRFATTPTTLAPSGISSEALRSGIHGDVVQEGIYPVVDHPDLGGLNLLPADYILFHRF